MFTAAWKLYLEVIGSTKNPKCYGCSKNSGRFLIISWMAAGKTEFLISNGRPNQASTAGFYVLEQRGKCLTSEEEQASYWLTGAETWLMWPCEAKHNRAARFYSTALSNPAHTCSQALTWS